MILLHFTLADRFGKIMKTTPLREIISVVLVNCIFLRRLCLVLFYYLLITSAHKL